MSPSLDDDFKISGPKHMSSINWTSLDDQRVVLACLVNAIYVKEHDIQHRRDGAKALAPAWWQHFNFELKEQLRDTHDSSIFGCIYELKRPCHAESSAPKFVVAIRGTMLDLEHGFMDFMLDLLVMIGGINKSSRVDDAVKSISKLISHCNPQNVWVAGHSMGASIATIAGKYMAKKHIHLKTFLFNPPFPSIPHHFFPDHSKLRERLHKCKTTFKFAASVFKKDYCIKSHEEFLKLASWTPYLFVNPEDPISESYISYFKRLENIEGVITSHVDPVETLKGTIMTHIREIDTYTSLREICSDVVGDLEMPHLLPSACLRKNLKKSNSLRLSHGILQWCQQDIQLEPSDHHYHAA